jgi:magnesium-transporting ATPase (P-type)
MLIILTYKTAHYFTCIRSQICRVGCKYQYTFALYINIVVLMNGHIASWRAYLCYHSIFFSKTLRQSHISHRCDIWRCMLPVTTICFVITYHALYLMVYLIYGANDGEHERWCRQPSIYIGVRGDCAYSYVCSLWMNEWMNALSSQLCAYVYRWKTFWSVCLLPSSYVSKHRWWWSSLRIMTFVHMPSTPFHRYSHSQIQLGMLNNSTSKRERRHPATLLLLTTPTPIPTLTLTLTRVQSMMITT